MLQHYSVSWKKGLAALCLLAVAGLSGCDQQENAAAKVEYDGLSNSQPLRVDTNNHTVTMLVQINGRFLTDDTRHGIVFKDGSNGHKSLFMGYATPKAFYEALKEAGGTPGENMTMDNKETTHVTGSKLDISVNWQGAAKAYSFDEVIVDSNGKKLDMRFGGNLTAAEEKKTGCLVCLDSCPVGIVSNATYTYGAVEKRGEVKFKGNASVLHEFINRSVAAFAAVDQQGIERFIQSYGALAAVVSFLLMILQAIAAPLPAFLITFANASLFGAFWGGLLSWTSSMAGAALCFFIARVMGREVVEKLTGKTVLDSMDGFFTRYGKHTILVCRLLPFVPFDPISYAAGLTSIRFRSFFIATGLGQLPATIVYSWAGSMLTGGTFWFVTGLFILFALTVVIFMAKKIWLERQKRNA